MRPLLLVAALALAGCAQPEPAAEAASVTPAAEEASAREAGEPEEAAATPAAPPPPAPAHAEGSFVASVGSAHAEQTVAGSTAPFDVAPGVVAFMAVGNWTSSAGTGAEMRLRSPSGEWLAAGSIGAANTAGSEEMRVTQPEPGTWTIAWRAAGAAASVTWTVDVTFA